MYGNILFGTSKNIVSRGSETLFSVSKFVIDLFYGFLKYLLPGIKNRLKTALYIKAVCSFSMR